MTTQETLLLQHLNKRLMFCETEEEENYVKEEIRKLDKISPRDTGIVSDCNSMGVAVSGDLRQTDVRFLRTVLQNIDDVNAELDPIEQIGWKAEYNPDSNWYWIWLYLPNAKRVIWQTGADKSAFLEIIRGYEA